METLNLALYDAENVSYGRSIGKSIFPVERLAYVTMLIELASELYVRKVILKTRRQQCIHRLVNICLCPLNITVSNTTYVKATLILEK